MKMDFEFEILRAYVREKNLCEEEEQQEGEKKGVQEGEERQCHHLDTVVHEG